MISDDGTFQQRLQDIGTRTWQQEDLEHVGQCPVCESSERTLLHDGLTDRVFCCAPGSWTLYTCSDCGSAYLDPRPTPASIGRAYTEYYTHTESKSASIGKLSRLKQFRVALKNGYWNWCFGTRLVPASALGVPLACAFPGLRESLEAHFRYMPKFAPGARLLDIGAGNGDFLALARSVGWVVQGIDMDPKAVNVCRDRGLDVRQGGVEQYAGKSACFDFITISHVIEHVHDPHHMLQCAFDLLSPGGCLYVETPNIDALGHNHSGVFWRGLEPPRHLTLFNWRSLEHALRGVGFTRIKYRPRSRVYAGLAAKSRALRRGCDCYRAKVSLGDRVMGRILAVRMLFGFMDSEFVTILAYKNAKCVA